MSIMSEKKGHVDNPSYTRYLLDLRAVEFKIIFTGVVSVLLSPKVVQEKVQVSQLMYRKVYRQLLPKLPM